MDEGETNEDEAVLEKYLLYRKQYERTVLGQDSSALLSPLSGQRQLSKNNLARVEFEKLI